MYCMIDLNCEYEERKLLWMPFKWPTNLPLSTLLIQPQINVSVGKSLSQNAIIHYFAIIKFYQKNNQAVHSQSLGTFWLCIKTALCETI
jgi:hypothetical protein